MKIHIYVYLTDKTGFLFIGTHCTPPQPRPPVVSCFIYCSSTQKLTVQFTKSCLQNFTNDIFAVQMYHADHLSWIWHSDKSSSQNYDCLLTWKILSYIFSSEFPGRPILELESEKNIWREIKLPSISCHVDKADIWLAARVFFCFVLFCFVLFCFLSFQSVFDDIQHTQITC